jgi:hypothetical protein
LDAVEILDPPRLVCPKSATGAIDASQNHALPGGTPGVFDGRARRFLEPRLLLALRPCHLITGSFASSLASLNLSAAGGAVVPFPRADETGP